MLFIKKRKLIRAGIRRCLKALDTPNGRIGVNCALALIACGIGIRSVQSTYKVHVQVANNPAGVTAPIELWWHLCIFSRFRSRLTGFLLYKKLPVTWRATVYSCLAHVFNAQIEEARYPLETYKSVGEFFTRSLKDDCRPLLDIDPDSLICPCDGEVISFGEVRHDRLPQVKGTTYSLSGFLGNNVLQTCQSCLYQCVLYLAPGDYHCFHSPADLDIRSRRHFPGETLPVCKRYAAFMNDIFAVNERVILSSQWKHGRLFYAAVGAYNVASIRLDIDPELWTNDVHDQTYFRGGEVFGKALHDPSNLEGPLHVKKGQRLGNFRLGSTIVLIFEGPPGLKWRVQEGARIKLGEPLAGFSDNIIPSDNKGCTNLLQYS
eukprot:GHVL01025083.1.p1 GENE.GHVL01025083.1~~GHVL01025083.1.p1  ORF type:complete len:376 (+),score=39.59 GHVL01025083.1:39-1166(+)